MKKFLRKLLPTIVMLAVSATLVGTSTFAWFSMNNKVTVTGMTIKTKTSTNLFVQGIEATATSLPDEAGYQASLSQVKTGLLQPVSTTTANSSAFFYHTTESVSTQGKPTESGATYIDYDVTGVTAATDSTAYADKFSENYAITRSDATEYEGKKASAYVDYVIILKAVNVDGASNIYLEYANLVYDGRGSINAKSYRLAIFAEKWNGSAFGDMNLISILTPPTAANFTSGKAVATTTTLDTVTYNAEAKITPITANTTEYYRVTARLYLEGEDNTCNNETYMKLTSTWSLDLAFKLATTGSGATNLSHYEHYNSKYWDGTKAYDKIDGSDEGVVTSSAAWMA